MVVSSCACSAVGGEGAGGGFKFGRGRRDGFDDLADRAFEVVRQLLHVGLALPGRSFFVRPLLRPHPLDLHCVGLEELNCPGHRAKFVATLLARDICGQIIVGKRLHDRFQALIARGVPDVSGVTVVTCLRAFYFCTQGCGCIERLAFPALS
jgi:hypothetical protein